MSRADGREAKEKGLFQGSQSSITVPSGLLQLPSGSNGPSAIPHRHSAPSIFHRSAWRRRSSAQPSDLASIREPQAFARGPLGLTLLHEPSEARVDFIFVHGLHGGSRKTWSIKPEDPATFWPEGWLPFEPGFKHVRIHTFGYDSDWSKTQHSVLTIRDFAASLLSNISNSQVLKKSGNVRLFCPAVIIPAIHHMLTHYQTPIVFVAHSMGGLVIKQVGQTLRVSFKLDMFETRLTLLFEKGIYPSPDARRIP